MRFAARSARLPGAWTLGDGIEALEGLGLRCEWVEATADQALQSAAPVLLLRPLAVSLAYAKSSMPKVQPLSRMWLKQ